MDFLDCRWVSWCQLQPDDNQRAAGFSHQYFPQAIDELVRAVQQRIRLKLILPGLEAYIQSLPFALQVCMDADPLGRLLPLPFLNPDSDDVSVTVNAFLSANLLVGVVADEGHHRGVVIR